MSRQQLKQGPSLLKFFLFDLPKRELDPLGIVVQWREQYGDVISLPLRRPPSLQLGNPEDIKHVLVTNVRNYRKTGWLVRGKDFLGEGLLTSGGSLHTRQRNILKPAFHRQTVLSYADIIVQSATERVEQWNPGTVVNISREMARLTLVNIGKTFLSTDLTNVADDLIASFTVCQHFMMRWTSFLPDRFPTLLRQRYVAAVEQIDKVVYGIIADRRSMPSRDDDFLSVLFSAASEDGRPLHNRLIRDEIVTMLWAGHETTYNALEWTWYLLSQNPEVESRLTTELKDVLGANRPNGVNLQNLHYADMVFAETLRLYPPAWILSRWAMGDDALDSGMTIPAGTQVFIIPYAVHRDPRFFPNPDRFDPDRFNSENKTRRPPFAYFPFGGGQHVCIGEHFGKMEGVLTLATIAQQCRLTLVPGQHVTPKPLLTLRPKYDIMMRVAKRF